MKAAMELLIVMVRGRKDRRSASRSSRHSSELWLPIVNLAMDIGFPFIQRPLAATLSKQRLRFAANSLQTKHARLSAESRARFPALTS